MSDLSGIGGAASAVSNTEPQIFTAGSPVAQDAPPPVQTSAPSVGTYAAIMVLLDSLTERVSASPPSTAPAAGVDAWA
jgi:hypothetical protein